MGVFPAARFDVWKFPATFILCLLIAFWWSVALAVRTHFPYTIGDWCQIRIRPLSIFIQLVKHMSLVFYLSSLNSLTYFIRLFFRFWGGYEWEKIFLAGTVILYILDVWFFIISILFANTHLYLKGCCKTAFHWRGSLTPWDWKSGAYFDGID